MNTVNDFIEQYYPDYSTSDKITRLDSLQKCIDDNWDNAKDEYMFLRNNYPDYPDSDNRWIRVDHADLEREVLIASIGNYLKATHGQEV
jgi:hypothetical protein